MSELIRTGSVLPAHREALTLITADGLRLVAELSRPLHREPVATIICVHPLPTHGGMMDSHVLRKAAWRLPAQADIAVLRFNTRGTTSASGTSEGEYDRSTAEGLDLQSDIAYAQQHHLVHPWLLGWSFGTDVILRHASDAAVAGVILLSPPLRFTTPTELSRWRSVDTPVTALVPEFDDYLPPTAAVAAFAGLPAVEIVGIPGAKHLWVGERYVQRVLNEIVSRVNPVAAPLATEWTQADVIAQGPMQMWSDL